jgi:hypothetical protein
MHVSRAFTRRRRKTDANELRSIEGPPAGGYNEGFKVRRMNEEKVTLIFLLLLVLITGFAEDPVIRDPGY